MSYGKVLKLKVINHTCTCPPKPYTDRFDVRSVTYIVEGSRIPTEPTVRARKKEKKRPSVALTTAAAEATRETGDIERAIALGMVCLGEGVLW